MHAPRSDVRLDDAAMQPVSCRTCEASITARKSSWDQTTLQWTADALARCQERDTTMPSDRPNRHAFAGCAAMKESVRAAAVAGSLDVQSEFEAESREP